MPNLHGIEIRPLVDAEITVDPVKSLIHVAGDDNGVALDFNSILVAEGDAARLRRSFIAITHTDEGPHKVEVKLSTIARVLIGCNGADAIFDLFFDGSKSYRAEVERDGTTSVFDALTKPLVVANAEATPLPHDEVVKVDFQFGLRRADTWSVVVTHGACTLTFTPEEAHSPAASVSSLEVKTSGLSNIQIVPNVEIRAPE